MRLLSGRSGFTMLEMLVVISLLAAVAFVATTGFKDVASNTEQKLVRAEMNEIATAIRRFKQDTGYYPGEGPFGLEEDGGLGAVTPARVKSCVGFTPTQLDLWFHSPANFYQLTTTVSPLPTVSTEEEDTHPLAEWIPETGRGWRGPYLAGCRDGYVDIGDDINDSNKGPEGDPLLGTGIPDVPGLADPFMHRSEPCDEEDEECKDVDDTLLDWSRTPRPNRADIKWGRPYLFLHDTATGRRWLHSMGPNGKYDTSDERDDIELIIE